jgi:uncharacterized lipoprotein YmbA
MTPKITLYFSIIYLFSQLTSCASKPINVNYYTLNGIENTYKTSIDTASSEQQPVILLSTIKLADFLATGALVMQLESHQIQLSNQHRWADNLADAITRRLLNALEGGLPDYRFELNNLLWKSSAQAYITININQFTVLADNTTLTSGTFLLFDKNNQPLHKQSFSINRKLSQNGYNHAVVQLELSLSTLAQQISPLLINFVNTK